MIPSRAERAARAHRAHRAHGAEPVELPDPAEPARPALVTPAPRRGVRWGFAAASVIGIVGLAGCAGATEAADPDRPADSGDGADSGSGPAAATGDYADGEYTAEGSYATPESVETISVTITLDGGTITDVEVVGDPQKSESEEYQGEFIGGIADVVVGKSIDEIQVSRVAGSSLTSGGFNQAIEEIKSQAAS
jgi:uncharacterized protein with FMN-binding domain